MVDTITGPVDPFANSPSTVMVELANEKGSTKSTVTPDFTPSEATVEAKQAVEKSIPTPSETLTVSAEKSAPAKKEGFFSRLFGGKKKKEEDDSLKSTNQPIKAEPPSYRVVGDVTQAIDSTGSAIPGQVVVSVDLEKQTGSEWNQLTGGRSDGDMETAYRQAVAIFKNYVLKDYPEAADVKIPSPKELVGYDAEIAKLNESAKPEQSSKSDKPIVSRVYGEIFEETGVSPDEVGKIDFSTRYVVDFFGEYFDGRKVHEVDAIYGKANKDPEEAYKSAEENFLKAVRLDSSPSAKLPPLNKLDGYSDIADAIGKPKGIVNAQDNKKTDASTAKSSGEAVSSNKVPPGSVATDLTSGQTPAEQKVSPASVATELVKTEPAAKNEKSQAQSTANQASAPAKPSATAAATAEDPSKLSDKEFNELVKMQRLGETEKLVEKSADLSKRLKGESKTGSQTEPTVPSQSVATDLVAGPTQSTATVSNASVATDLAAKTSTQPSSQAVASPSSTAVQAAGSQAKAQPSAAGAPTVQVDEFTKFLTKNVASITPDQVKAANDAASKAKEATAKTQAEGDKTDKSQPGNTKPSETVKAESVANAFTEDGEQTAADLALEAYLNSGFTDADVKGLDASLKRSQDFKSALDNRPAPTANVKADSGSVLVQYEEPSDKAVASESIATEIAKSPSATLQNKPVASESIATEIAKSPSTKSVASESIATEIAKSPSATPSKTAVATSAAEDPSKLSDKEFNELAKLQQLGETEKLVQKSADLSKRLKGQGPSLPSESVAPAVAETAQKKEESIATNFTTKENAKVSEQSIASTFVQGEASNKTAPPPAAVATAASEPKADLGKYEVVGSVSKLKGDNVRLDLDLINKDTGKSVVGTGSSGRPLAEAYADASKSMNDRLAERGLSAISIPDVSKLTGADTVAPKAEMTPASTLNSEANSKDKGKSSESEQPTKKSKGFFSKIKSLFTGSDDESKSNKSNKESEGPGSKLGGQFGEKTGAASAETIKNTFGLTLDEQKKVNSGEDLYSEDEDAEKVESASAQPSTILEKQNAAAESTQPVTGEVNISNVLAGESKRGTGEASTKSTAEPEISVQGSKPLNRGLANAVLNPPNPVKEGIDNLAGVVQSSSSEMTAGVSAAVTGAVSSIPAAMTSSTNYSTINNTNADQSFAQSSPQGMMSPPSQEKPAMQPSEMTSDHYMRLLYEAIVTHGIKLRTI